MERNINFFIDHQCPQCGAPAKLSETDRLFRCEYCKTSSYLWANRFFRYLLPNRAPAGKELIYFPYWRFKGMLFSYLASGIEDRFLDVSQQAVPSPLFPLSLGVRSQAMKLRFVNPDTDGWFIEPTLSFGKIMEQTLSLSNLDLPSSALHQAHIGESISMIYAPFYADHQLMDAVLNKPISKPSEPPPDLSQFEGGPAHTGIHFLATLCPNCGWDMEGRRDALVLHCMNCQSLWKATKSGFSRVNVAHVPAPAREDTIFLPFWRIGAEVSGISLKSYADLVKGANLPKAIQPSWHERPFYFWSPAFKLSPHSFLRVTRQVTASQPDSDFIAEVPQAEMHPINLPATEAAETMKLTIAEIIRPKKRIEASIHAIHVKPLKYLLFYLPFEKRHHDLVHTAFNIAINRQQLALSDNL